MIIRELFEKPVDRFIEGVIKADDDQNLLNEMQEYIVTRDIGKKLKDIIEPYSQEPQFNGVWISGFFGSGKSHLLKMLSVALNQKVVNGENLSEIFLEKVKETEDQFLVGELDRALKIPSENILFNIDQKADATAQYTSNRILGVFLKVFNQHCGYCDRLPFIAEFERDMDEEGYLQALKEAYQEDHGENWETERHRFHTIRMSKFAQTYQRVRGVSEQQSREILVAYRDSFSISIEDFAEKVRQFINKKPDRFRLNFFVDEVGQFIAESTQLMLNLQSIAETLATRCDYRAWLFVTSQASLDEVFGNAPGSGFGRIMDRFKIKVNLDGKDVSEVIQLRLLKKQSSVVPSLTQTYDLEKENIRTLFDFGEGRKYQLIRSEIDFAKSHPFMPYQYELFQQAMSGLARHGAFTSRHTSVGERSMLGVFQDVLKEIADEQVGHLATFDRMFSGVRQALKPSYLNLINSAENNFEYQPLAVRILKILALVKYVDAFRPTSRNLAILLIDSFQTNSADLIKKVEESLQLLEQQTYIQRNGELYSYLTHVEQEIEQNIRSTDVSPNDQMKFLAEMIFNEIIKVKQFRFEDNQQNYTFARKLDGSVALGQDSELALNVVSPFHEHAGNESIIRSHSVGKSEMLILLAEDRDFISDLIMYLKTDRYSRTQSRDQADENIRGILRDKDTANETRRKNLISRAQELLKQSKLFVSNNELSVSGDAISRIQSGFQELVRATYPNLKMLNGHKAYEETDLRKILLENLDDLFGGGAESATEAEQELINQVRSRYSRGETTSFRNIEEVFTRKPYGWPAITVKCLLCRIYRRGLLEIRAAGNSLDENQLLQKLPQTGQASLLMLSLQADVDPAKLHKFKLFHRDLFKQTNSNNDRRGILREFRDQLGKLINEIEGFFNQRSQYTFLSSLENPLEKLKTLAGKTDSDIFENLDALRDEYLDLFEDHLDPIQGFMTGSQFKIYKEVVEFWRINQNDTQQYAAEEVENFLKLEKSLTPWNDTQPAKSSLESAKLQIAQARENRIKEAIADVERLTGELRYQTKFASATAEQQEQILKPLLAEKNSLPSIQSPSAIAQRRQQIKDKIYVDQLNALHQLNVGDEEVLD